MKTELWWASIGGGKTEPVRVIEENGRKLFYSIGCNDPHEMEGVELLELVHASEMPLSKRSQAAQDAANARWQRYRSEIGRNLSYRRFE